MTRLERIAPFRSALSDDEFEEFLSAASYAAGDESIYERLTEAEKAEISSAITRLDRGEGVDYSAVKARLRARLKSAGL